MRADQTSYAALRSRRDAPAGSSWGLFGPDDRVGTLNFAGPEQARAAATEVRTGQTFTLDYPLDAFDPPLAQSRKAPSHHVYQRHTDHRDDYLDGFYPQASTQLDGLRHRRHHQHGFYNGGPEEELGIHQLAERGLVSRGLLLELSPAVDHEAGTALGAEQLREAVERQGVTPRTGDVLLLHTGWAHWYLGLDRERRSEVRAAQRFTGLDQSHEVLAWLWDHHPAAVVSDTFALEALPARPDSPFGRETDNGMMHQQMLAMLGLAVGELWRLEPLAEACAREARWTCLLTAQPLNLRGGVGSPANALAVR